MHKTTKPLLLVTTAALILACSLSTIQNPTPVVIPTATDAPATETPTASLATDTAVPSATTTPVRGELPVSYNGVNLLIPAGLATGTTNTSSTDVEFPYTNPSGGPMPQHTKIVLTGYRLQDTALEPQVLVFSAKDYAGYSELTAQIITALQGLKYAPGQPVPAGLPVGAISAQIHPVSFPRGKGIAYLTQFDQTALPINNREMFYYFHGLTEDGKTYVEAILPVSAPFLAVDENPFSHLPTLGVPFQLDNLQGYYGAITTKLNATLREQFIPQLSTLDTLVGTITTH